MHTVSVICDVIIVLTFQTFSNSKRDQVIVSKSITVQYANMSSRLKMCELRCVILHFITLFNLRGRA
jgi:hypothetical protein